MSANGKVRLGLVGMGGMGSGHLAYLPKMANVDIVAVCDILPERADAAAARSGATAYYDHMDMFSRAGLDAVLIATPHYDHTTISVHAFEQGLHVLSEKPLAVHVNDAKKSIAAYEKARDINPDIVFGLMFQERANAAYRKLRDILAGGELGRLTRVTWINTAWFRSQAYYNNGGWRATWAGEGGGILTNQCPHNLDMYQWLFGMPARISGHASLGKYHDIEVEDEVAAYFEHENGMVGHFVVTTGECPGTNRLEICGEYGKLVLEHGKLTFDRNRESMLSFCRETKSSFDTVETWHVEIPTPRCDEGHQVVTEKFVKAILNKQPMDLIAHGLDGIRGVTLANGIMLSSFEGTMVSVPIDSDAFEARLRSLIKTSTYVKPGTDASAPVADISSSFTHGK